MKAEHYTESEHVVAGMSSYVSGNYIDTVNHLNFLIECKLNHLKVSENDVKDGCVHDSYLGFLYRLLSVNFERLGQIRRHNKALYMASLCGDTTASEELAIRNMELRKSCMRVPDRMEQVN